MRTILRIFLGVLVLYVLTTTTAFSESTGFMYLSRGEVTILETGEISMVCHGIPAST